MPKKEKPVEKTAEEIRAEQEARGDFVEDGEGVQASEEEAEEAEEAEEEEVEAAAGEEVEATAEEEVEPELEAAAEEEEEVDEPGAKADDTIMVPKGRLDEVLHKSREREEELQRRLNAAEERTEKETTSENVDALELELDELDKKYGELFMEGELDKANETRKEWRKKQNDLFDIRLEQRSALASRQAVESMRFDRQLAEYEVKYSVINFDSENYDPDTAKEVAELMDAFEAQGWNRVAALNKAVKYVIPEKENASTEGLDPDVVRTKRKVAARRKVADVVSKSPPDITDKGRDSDKVGTGDGLPDVTKMSPSQFAELSEAQLRKLRGDSLTDQEAAS